MSALVRRGWDSILAEVLRGARGKNYASYSTRLQYMIWEAYFQVASLFHHQELETTASSTLSTGANTLAFPSDCHLLMAVAELDANSLPKKYVAPIDIKLLSGLFLGSNSGQPEQYAAFNRVVIFDRKTDQDRAYTLYYMKRPAEPDFATSTVPSTGPQWDASIIDLSLMRAAIRDGDPETARIYAEAFRDFATQQFKPLLKDSTAPNLGEIPTSIRPAGESQT